MTECQGCGAWNDASRTVCVLCGTPLAATDEWDAATEPPPLPPLPDGGLRASMPAWLREPPDAVPPVAPPPAASAAPPPADMSLARQPAQLAPLGPRADPRTFLTDDDFPRWLRELAAREAHGRAPAPGLPTLAPGLGMGSAWHDGSAGPLLATGPLARPHVAGATDVDLGASDGPAAPEPAPSPDALPAPASVLADARDDRRPREPWETLLLALLVIGVIAAALWALVSNGVFSPAS